MVGYALGILPIEVKAMLYQELHRLWFYNIFLHAQQSEIEHLDQVGVFTLKEEDICYIKIWKNKSSHPMFPWNTTHLSTATDLEQLIPCQAAA